MISRSWKDTPFLIYLAIFFLQSFYTFSNAEITLEQINTGKSYFIESKSKSPNSNDLQKKNEIKLENKKQLNSRLFFNGETEEESIPNIFVAVDQINDVDNNSFLASEKSAIKDRKISTSNIRSVENRIFFKSERIKEPSHIWSIDGELNLNIEVLPMTTSGSFVTYTARAYKVNGEAEIPAPTFHVYPGDKININFVNNLEDSDDRMENEEKPINEMTSVNTNAILNTLGAANNTGIYFRGLRTTQTPVSPPIFQELSSNDNTDDGNLLNAIHFHALDNSPLASVPPRTEAIYSFQIASNHAPGVHWYLDPTISASALHVMGGLFGAIIVEPEDEFSAARRTINPRATIRYNPNARGKRKLSSQTNEKLQRNLQSSREFPTSLSALTSYILHLHHFSYTYDYASKSNKGTYQKLREATKDTMPSTPLYTEGLELDNMYLVNGLFQPELVVTPQTYVRLDLLHSAVGDHVLQLQIRTEIGSGSPACSMHAIAFDGIYLSNPRSLNPLKQNSRTNGKKDEISTILEEIEGKISNEETDGLFLAPGQRASIIISCEETGVYFLQSNPTLTNGNTTYPFGGVPYQQNLVTIYVTDGIGVTTGGELPTGLGTIDRPNYITETEVENIDHQWELSTRQADIDQISDDTSDPESFWLGVGKNCLKSSESDTDLIPDNFDQEQDSSTIYQFRDEQCIYTEWEGTGEQRGIGLENVFVHTTDADTIEGLTIYNSAPETGLWVMDLPVDDNDDLVSLSNKMKNNDLPLASGGLYFDSGPFQIVGYEPLPEAELNSSSTSLKTVDYFSGYWGQIGDWRDTLPPLPGIYTIRYSTEDLKGEYTIHDGNLLRRALGEMTSYWVGNTFSVYPDVLTSQPTGAPTEAPTSAPTTFPTIIPTPSPTLMPTSLPTSSPTTAPTTVPTNSPTTASPTFSPTHTPTKRPTPLPTTRPTNIPTKLPTTASPTQNPTAFPTTSPTSEPTKRPTPQPTGKPTNFPTMAPTDSPTRIPTRRPSPNPTKAPTPLPTKAPTNAPTTAPPTERPTKTPTKAPTTASPTPSPTNRPTISPTPFPTRFPTFGPTRLPTTAPPTQMPTPTPVLRLLVTITGSDGILAITADEVKGNFEEELKKDGIGKDFVIVVDRHEPITGETKRASTLRSSLHKKTRGRFLVNSIDQDSFKPSDYDLFVQQAHLLALQDIIGAENIYRPTSENSDLNIIEVDELGDETLGDLLRNTEQSKKTKKGAKSSGKGSTVGELPTISERNDKWCTEQEKENLLVTVPFVFYVQHSNLTIASELGLQVVQTFDAVSLEELYGDYSSQLCAASLVEVAQVWTFPTPSPTKGSADTSGTDEITDNPDFSDNVGDDPEDPTNTALIVVGVVGMLAIMLWAGRVVRRRRGESSEGMISYRLRPTDGDNRREFDSFSYASSPGRNGEFNDGYNYDSRYMNSPSPRQRSHLSTEFDGVGVGGASDNVSPHGYSPYSNPHPHGTLQASSDRDHMSPYYRDQHNNHEVYSPESHEGSHFYSRSPSPIYGHRDYDDYEDNYHQTQEELYYPQSQRGVNARNNHYV